MSSSQRTSWQTSQAKQSSTSKDLAPTTANQLLLPTSKPSQHTGHSAAMHSRLEILPKARNSPRAVKVTFGNAEMLRNLDAWHEDLENLTQASKQPSQCFSSTETKHPKDARSPAATFISACRPQWTRGGDQVGHPGNIATKAANLTTTKILVNSVLSTPGAKMFLSDLKDFHFGASTRESPST